MIPRQKDRLGKLCSIGARALRRSISNFRKELLVFPHTRELRNISRAPFVDTHCHLNYILDYAAHNENIRDYATLYKSCFPNNMASCINVLCSPSDLDKYHMIQHELVYHSVGVHPHQALAYTHRVEQQLEELLSLPKVVACGEMGLDYHYNKSPPKVQQKVFTKQIELALRNNKPIVVHTREAEEDTLEIMKAYIPQNWKIHVHCFTSSPGLAERLLFHFSHLYLGITGVVTFASAKDIQEIVRNVAPTSRLLLETDGPYMVPNRVQHEFRRYGKVKASHPGMIPYIAEKVGELSNIPVDRVLGITRENTRNMYGV
ncbi:hypothetical protein K493DRAFT_274448 [Basidiobolus meristosporus CBS 931.73]|uniref:Metallo-dependent hydrolase n=1 Tax=Basidiobolus meristosporus CBS 931.73 TaxID=1314790 RepID=A0A1Y1Z7S9_9FUNG|nr:hypothetical protein K493DRAFT_274448 [Basidiobolus meristosporus CBS 931.73]|eukprot:ORY06339.1 hypothetical protein K493DRAFT_274448 [Basidiobolus meristosporus CBS 931.73]